LRIKPILFAILFFLPVTIWAQTLDIYGGDSLHACVGVLKNGSPIPAPTGFFYLYKDTNIKHWMFCDPLGNRYFHNAVQLIQNSYSGSVNITTKYGGGTYDFYKAQVLRLQALGFNGVGWGSDPRMYPMTTNYGSGNPNPIPFFAAFDPLQRYRNVVRDWVNYLPPSYNDYRGPDLDLFDPAWAAALSNCTTNCFTTSFTDADLNNSPWAVGFMIDETDELFGHSLTHAHTGFLLAMAAPYWGGWVNTQLYTKTQWQTQLTAKYGTVGALNTAWGSTYSTLGTSAATVTGETIGTGDGVTTSFSHSFAHGTVDPVSIGIYVAGTLSANDCPWFSTGDSLNNGCSDSTANTATITTITGTINGGTVSYKSGGPACGAQVAPCITVIFSAAPANGVAIAANYQYGGWPKNVAGGTGLMDEDGSSAWYPSDNLLASCNPGPCGGNNPAMATDMDTFYSSFFHQYFSTVSVFKTLYPNHPYVGPDAVITTDRPKFIAQEAAYVDIFFATGAWPTIPGRLAANIAAYNTYGFPFLMYSVNLSNADSPLCASCATPGDQTCVNGLQTGGYWPCSDTQVGRGQQYLTFAKSYFNDNVGADGYGFVVGVEFWRWVDDLVERQNFGIVTNNDNLYDGVEDTTAKGVDPLGYVTTPETKNFGDFVSNVKTGNRIWLGP
jgi:hypothetical protein